VTRPTRTRRPTARGSGVPPPGAKTARGLATQAAIVRAAQTVFERDGFLGARIADIMATARTATGSFYTYFNGKEEVFLAVVAALHEAGLHPPSLAHLTRPAPTPPRWPPTSRRTTAPTSRPITATPR
jgi:AcrR family transcriptional regulator